eukprot:TRINITY_DN7087_c0_g2_i1.p1 TRINITY_DN7087_c0_g2~~TRINITY_DN7087_c0_g2_i1.p1  ORF type:complete len:282 (+),score=79.04 TRINITY_DN7087_c0_g2_i1:82-846(+)
MKLVLLAVAATGAVATDGCSAKDVGTLALLSAKGTQMGADCEAMCKRIGAYPNCQCPGFNGEPASGGDTRACMVKYCQDPAAPCPNDAFVGCVKKNTAVSVLQWDAVFAQLSSGLDSLKHTMVMSKEVDKKDEKACNSRMQQGYSALLQAKAEQMGDVCEDMCRKVGSYPNCQCPGFGGSAASAGDDRDCMDKYCQDPKNACPNDAFMSCVTETTKVSTLQWDAVFQHVSNGLDSLNRIIQLGKNGTAKNATKK